MGANKLIIPLLLGASLILFGCNQPGAASTGSLQVFQGPNELTSGGSYGFGNVIEGNASAPVDFTMSSDTRI